MSNEFSQSGAYEKGAGEGEMLGKLFFRTMDGVDPALLSFMDEEYDRVFARVEVSTGDVVPGVADFRIKENAGYESITYDESVREFVGGVVSPEQLDELAKIIGELSMEDQAVMVSYAKDFFDIALFAETRDKGSHSARISTVATMVADVGPGAPIAVDDTASSTENPKEFHLSINPKLENVKRVLTTFLATVSAALALQAPPAVAGEWQNRARQQFEQQAKTAVFNGVFTGVRSVLAEKGIYIDGGTPIPMPGAQVPVYGGSPMGGYEIGRGMSAEQQAVIRQIQSYEQQLGYSQIRIMQSQGEVEKWCGLSNEHPRDSRWAQSCASAVAQRDRAINDRARIVNEIGRLQEELRYTR